MSEIFLGVVSGVITGLLTIATKKFWTNTVIPWYLALKYDGIDISGAWTFYVKDTLPIPDGSLLPGEEYTAKSRIVLEQKAKTITGTCVYEYKEPAKNFAIDYKLKGTLSEGYLILNFSPADNRICSYATALLKISGGGTHLSGQFVFRNTVHEYAEAILMNFTRDERVSLDMATL